jgi:hypothetical protein
LIGFGQLEIGHHVQVHCERYSPAESPCRIGICGTRKLWQGTTLYRANIPRADRYILWREAFQIYTLLDGLMMIKIDGLSKTQCEHIFGKNPDISKHLRFWGEAGMVKIKTKTTPLITESSA